MNDSGGFSSGGLVGWSHGTISNSYATGAVSGFSYVGGLVGQNYGTVNSSYAAGAVVTSGAAGGLVGTGTGTVTDSYWDKDTTGQTASAGGGTGLSTTDMQSTASFSGFTFTTTPGATGNNWVMVDADGTLNNAGGAAGATFPMLASEYATTITNAHQLQLMAMALAGSYSLGADIDASATAGTNDIWSTSGGFSPIGPTSTPFTGTFDGLGHTISGLSIVTSPSNGSGMFGASGGTIENVGLVNESMTGGSYRSGGLVGENSGVVDNVYVTGNVTAGSYTGGVAGTNSGTIANSYSTATVTGGANVGGLVGGNYGTITGSYATGAVGGSWRIGGLAGFSMTGDTISNSYAAGAVSGTSALGGLLGANYGTVSDSHATGTVAGSAGSSGIGGLVGNNFDAVGDSYATGAVSGSTEVGGLVGSNNGSSGVATVSNSYATGTVSGTSNVGGLVGYNYAGNLGGSSATATISNSYATGSVSGSSDVGGLVGYNYAGSSGGFGTPGTFVATVDDSYATGAVSGSTNVGGLVGNSYTSAPTDSATVSNGFWDVATTGQAASPGGGTGLTTAQMQQQVTFDDAGWDFSNTWILYAGHTDPLLRVFMTPLTVTATSAIQTYDGAMYSGAVGVTYSVVPNGHLLGSLTYAGAGADVGTYAITPQGLYSDQQGYLITMVSGTLTVNPAPLTVTGTTVADKVYDGTTAADLTGGVLSGLIGADAGSVTLTQHGSFASPDVGTGVGVSASDGLAGAASGNYVLTQPTGLTADITPAMLTYTASPANVFAGSVPSGLTGTVSGFVGGDTLANATVGKLRWTTSATTASPPGAYSIDGSGLTASNYVFAQAAGNATALTVNPAADSGSIPLALLNTKAWLQAGAAASSDGRAWGTFGTPSMQTTAPERATEKLRVENFGVRLPPDAIRFNP